MSNQKLHDDDGETQTVEAEQLSLLPVQQVQRP